MTTSGSSVEIAHQSVRAFLLGLSSTSWPDFSCSNIKQGHLFLARLCIQYLRIWHRRRLTHELGNSDDHDTLASKSHFLSYSAMHWMTHVRCCGEEVAKILKTLGPILWGGSQDNQKWSEVYTSEVSIQESTETVPLSDEFLLARFNLANVFPASMSLPTQQEAPNRKCCIPLVDFAKWYPTRRVGRSASGASRSQSEFAHANARNAAQNQYCKSIASNFTTI